MDNIAVKMPTIEAQLAEFNELFSYFDDPMDKFAQIIDMGKSSKGLDNIDKKRSKPGSQILIHHYKLKFDHHYQEVQNQYPLSADCRLLNSLQN